MVPRKRWHVAALGFAVTAGSLLAPGSAGAAASTIGTDGYVHVAPNGTVLGVDPYYPKDGNGGYDVASYDITLGYDPSHNYVAGKAVIKATTTQELSQFNLDLRGMTVSSVRVNGAKANFQRAGEHELVIRPGSTLAKGAEFTVEVSYAGVPSAISTSRGPVGWQRSRQGGAFAAGAPHAARTWYPVNDTSVDKATFKVTVTAPQGYTVVSNGKRTGQSTQYGYSTTTWTEDKLVSPSSTMIGIGRFDVTEAELPGGVKAVHAVQGNSPNGEDLAAALPEAVRFLTEKLGDYPQGTAGGMYLADGLRFTYPAQGRPVYGACATTADVVYATAAQWWTNKLGVKMWKDAPLVESFARYSVWLYEAEREGVDINARYEAALKAAGNGSAFWGRKLSDPGRGNEFSVSDKGVLMVHALRRHLGDGAFFTMFRGFPEINDNWPQGWYDWRLFTEAVADRDLHDFYSAWVDGTTVPPDSLLRPTPPAS
ncbi:gluzincin family metallopeptidase [Streptoalloteichus hindustanus]|uniref:Peptidase family M1 n=1 Tax=Streptoalloteichus hindustanus TaxID=2017 RepID=A0A1M5MS99_STRHI|nr:hypothetical protein [Streptoalloteichus hindustanus]SHG80085.1 Peptidase family M1 [Streptoalloteichus hindustanus]